MGFELFAREHYRLPQLAAARLPDGVDDSVRHKLLTEHDIEIGGGLGAEAGKAWRIGLMGHGAKKVNADRLLEALQSML